MQKANVLWYKIGNSILFSDREKFAKHGCGRVEILASYWKFEHQTKKGCDSISTTENG